MKTDELRLAYESEGSDLHSFAESILEDGNDADDAVQQALRSLLEADAPPPEELRPYLFKAVRNAAFKILRDRDRRARTRMGWWQFRSALGSGKDVERLNAVRFAVSQLPPDIRDVVVLHHWNGLTLSQSADVLSIPKTTAEFRHKQAKDLLRATLRPESEK